jgi:hypothetical protein
LIGADDGDTHDSDSAVQVVPDDEMPLKITEIDENSVKTDPFSVISGLIASLTSNKLSKVSPLIYEYLHKYLCILYVNIYFI